MDEPIWTIQERQRILWNRYVWRYRVWRGLEVAKRIFYAACFLGACLLLWAAIIVGTWNLAEITKKLFNW